MDWISLNRIVAVCLQNIRKCIISSELAIFIWLFIILFIDFSA